MMMMAKVERKYTNMNAMWTVRYPLVPGSGLKKGEPIRCRPHRASDAARNRVPR
jgi:hypothetical protein